MPESPLMDHRLYLSSVISHVYLYFVENKYFYITYGNVERGEPIRCLNANGQRTSR